MARTPQIGASPSNVYEDYQPTSEWKEEPESNIVVLHLPDFKKDQIHITCFRSPRIVRVTGERQLHHNKWSRFNQAFPVPQNCLLDKIHAKWHSGSLIITMPKEAVTRPTAPTDKAKTAPETPKAAAYPKTPKGHQQAADDVVLERIGASSEQRFEKEANLQKGDLRDESSFPKAASTTTSTTKQKDNSRLVPKAENIEQMTGKERRDGSGNMPTESIKSVKVTENVRDEVKENAFPKTSKKEKEKYAGEDKGKEKKDATAEKAKARQSIIAAAAKVVKGLAMEQDEDKRLLINMGAAVLVVVALGAYVAYRFGSKSEG